MEEIHPIPGHPLYGVSRDGRVWSKAKAPEWRELAQSTDGRGYRKVKLAGWTVTVHLLVAGVFLGDRPDGMVVDHVDGNKQNPAASNLQYVTQAENNRRAWRAGQQRSGWQTRLERLAAMGHHSFAKDGRYPGRVGRWERPCTEGGISHS